MPSARVFLLLALLTPLPAGEPPIAQPVDPPADWLEHHLSFQIDHPSGAIVGQALELVFRIYPQGGEAVTLQGSPTDAGHHLILTGRWDLVLEEIAHGAVIARTSLKPPDAGRGDPLTLPATMQAISPWSWDARSVITHPGNYRFTLTYGGIARSSGLIHADTTLDPPPWIAVTVTPSATRVALGEPVAVTIAVANHGVDDYHVRFGGDYRGTSRPMRFAFTGVRDDGRCATDPEPVQDCLGGLGMAGDLRPGGRHEQTVALNAYLRFPGPGTYQVTMYQALEFGTPVPARELPASADYGSYARAGSFTLTVGPPDPAQAAAIVARGLAASQATPEVESRSIEILAHLTEPYFLPALVAALAHADAEPAKALLWGINSIATVEATAALIAAARDPRAAVRAAALEILPWRLPEPNPDLGPAALERQRLLALRAAQTWSPELLPALMPVIEAAIADPDPATLGAAATLLGRAGGPGAIDTLAREAERLAPRLPIDPAHYQALNRLENAAYMLHRAHCPPLAVTATSAPGRLLCWASMLDNRHTAPEDGAVLLAMLAMPETIMRDAALRFMSQDFIRTHELPWLELFSDPGKQYDNSVGLYALNASHLAPPAVIRAALLKVPTAIWDGPWHSQFEQRLREVSAAGK